MKPKVRSQKSKLNFIFAPLRLCGILLLFLPCLAQNDVAKIQNGVHIENWLISSPLPAEIDAGMWENFNRFNIENLPQKDWLAPFGGVGKINPQEGTLKASVQTNNQTQISGDNRKVDLPEVGDASKAKVLSDVSEISWAKLVENDATIDFHGFHGGKPIGTAYAAAYLDAAQNEVRFLQTDGFLGSIWLNGEKIYDGYSLNVRKVAPAKFKAGKNLILVRASGVSGDYWRKNGGWTALIRFWKNEAEARNAAEYKSTGALGTIFYLEGFHVDPVYLQDQRGYSKVTLANTHQYVNSLRADPRYGVFLSEIDYLKPYLDTHPESREFLREAVRQGRVGTGGAYNQFNELNIGGEAIIRNILYGQEMHEAMLGNRAKSLSLWDVFGHAPQITQIAQKSGFNGIVWSKKITGFQPFFYDYALDGSRLLHRRVDYAYSFSGFGSGKNYTLDNFRQMTERKFAETQTFGSSVDLRINAADFTPPWTNLAGNVEKLETNRPQIRVTGQAQDLYFDALNKEITEGKVKPPVTSRDKLFFHVGVAAARSDLKVAHRAVENMTLTAEKFGTIAYLRGAKYPDLALDKAWRQIFFGSHHDAITGTPSDSAFLDLVHGYREAFELSKSALDDSLDFIAKQIDTSPKFKVQSSRSQVVPIVIFNPLSWKRTDRVKVKVEFPESVKDFVLVDEFNKKVEFTVFRGELEMPQTKAVFEGNKSRIVVDNSGVKQKISEFEFIAKDVPSIGYKTYFVVPTESTNEEKNIRNQVNAIENEFYKIMVDANRGGAISSIYDKQAKREIINTQNGHFANEIASLKEELTRKNVIYPAWEFWTTGEKKFSTEKSAKVIFYQRGETQTLAITGELPNMKEFVQIIELYKGVKRIDFKTELTDYKGYNELFTINFPLNLTGGALVTEDRFGTVVRNNSKGFLDFKSNTDKLVSGAPVYSVNNWAEYGSVLNLNFIDAGGKSVSSVPFKPTALVRPHGENYEGLTEQIVSSLIKRGVSVTPFYDDNDADRRKNLTIEDSTMPKNLNDDIAYHGFRIALGGEQESLYSAQLLKQVSSETKQKFAERLARDGFAYLFIYDKEIPQGWAAIPVLLIAGDVKKAVENLLAPIGKGEFSLNISAKSLADPTNLPKVENYGVALINNGTPAVSLENPNTLTLLLTHTAPFPGVNLPFEFVPENKTHVFTYALYPHEGDWREADTVKMGENFNNPLIAKQTSIHEGNLPKEKSFLSVNQENISVSAFKVGGNPQANFKKASDRKNRSLYLRFYETEGRKVNPMFTLGQNGWEFGVVGLLENFPADTLEVNGNGVGTEIDGYSIDAFYLKPTQFEAKENNSAQIGAVKEDVQPVFSRYWMHNMGAAPIGNDAVKVSLRRVEQMNDLSSFAWDDPYNQGGWTTVAVRVQVVNNYQDRNYKGEVALEVPEDWRVVPDKISFDIEPRGSMSRDVVLLAFPVKKNLEFERASGLVKAHIEHEGQTFQDVLQIGKTFHLEWETQKTANGVAVRVKNPHRQQIEGSMALIKPLETWVGGAYSFEPAAPREIGFAVPPRGEINFYLPANDEPDGTWAIARIAYNGNVEYKRADGKAK
jgi:alpha-mannosidase